MSGHGGNVYESSSADSSARPVYASSHWDSSAQDVCMSSQWDSSARPVYMSSQWDSSARPVYLTGCFPASELVHTKADACVPIGSLKVGNKISFWDVERKKVQHTAVTGIHKYTVNDIVCFNNAMRVSSSHPLMVMERGEHGIVTPKWKVAFDVRVGDCVVGADGKWFVIKSKSRHWHDAGIEVLNLSTENGVPFMVGNCVVRAENATDNIAWADAPITQKLWAETSITHESLTEVPFNHKLVA